MATYSRNVLATTALGAALAATAPLPARAISAFDAPAFGARAIPVVLDRGDAPLRYDVDPLTPSLTGCGDLSDGAVYVDLPGTAVPAPSGEGETAVGSDMVVAPRFVVLRTPDGAAPRDALSAVSVNLDGAPTASPAPVLTPVDAIEADPRAHLDAAMRFFPVVTDATALRATPAVFATPDPTSPQPGRLAPPPSGSVGDDAAAAILLAADALAEVGPSTWLYPAVSPGYLQELDLKGTITFASFRAPVPINAVAVDCALNVGADIVEAAFLPETPLLDTPPGPSLFDAPPVVVAVAAPRRGEPPLSNGSPRPPRDFPPTGSPSFFGGGGGGDPEKVRKPGDPIENIPAIPLPAAGLLYGVLLATGTAIVIRRRRTA